MKKSLITLIFIVVVLSVMAQEKQDTVKVEVFEEPGATSNFKKHDPFRYFRWSLLNEKSMFKFSVLPTFPSIFSFGTLTTIGYEHKITPSFSLGAELQSQITLVEAYSKEGKISNDYYAAPDVFVRYYYAQKKHMGKQVGGNNLLSNYLEMRYTDDFNTAKRTDGVFFGWGMQRRLGRYCYFDVGIGAGYSWSKDWLDVTYGISADTHVTFGMGFSNKNIRK